jgi:hypothetical protein
MNKPLKALIISLIIAFIATFAFSIITYEGVMYSPGISTAEMDTMSYTEASDLMAQRATKLSVYDYITNSVTTKYYWLNFTQLWVVMVIACFVTFLLTERATNGRKAI